MKKKAILGNQSGFTLIEIIAVLIIIGILSAVAVPKYFQLTTDAEEKAIASAGAEVQARLNQHFANQLLANNGSCTLAISALNDTSLDLDSLGDFSASISGTDYLDDQTNDTTLLIETIDGDYSGSYTLTTPLCD